MKKFFDTTRISGIVVVLLSAWSITKARTFGMKSILGTTDVLGPRAWPLFLSVVMLILGLVLIIQGDKSEEEKKPVDKKQIINLLVTIVAVVLYAALFKRLGFLIVTPIFIFGLTLYYGGKLPIAIGFSAGFTAFMYVLFKMVLHVLLPPIAFL